MKSRANLPLVVLSLALVLLPLTAFKPGMPATFKADEPAYYLAAESLSRDFDLRVDSSDLERIFQSFPYFHANNVIVSSSDGWHTLYFGKPYLYSLAAAPFVRLAGADGMIFFNMLMLVAMIWMGALWLRQFNPGWLADLFAVGFFVLGVPYAYVFWLHPEVFNMFSGAACLFFGLGMAGKRVPVKWALALSAAALAAGVYNKPMLAAIGLPVCFELLRKRRWAHLASWLVVSALSIGIYAAGSWALTGNPTAYLIELRAGFPVHSPYIPIVKPKEDRESEAAKAAAEAEAKKADDTESAEAEDQEKRAGWWWILQKPHVKGFELAEDIPYFFFGRHTGLFVHQPFVLLAFILFALHGLRRLQGWLILISALMVGAFFMITIPFNWHGGGGFVGNRYFVMACPAFIFIVTKIRPDWSVVPITAVGALLMGPTVLAPYSLVVPQPTLQSLVRNPTFDLLPMELSMAKIPGYHGMVQQGTWLYGRKDHLRPGKNGFLSLSAANRVDVWLTTDRPITRMELELISSIEGNRARLTTDGRNHEIEMGLEPTRLVLEPRAATVERKDRRRTSYFEFMDIWVYKLSFHIEHGQMPHWLGDLRTQFFVGAQLRLADVTFGATGDASASLETSPEPGATPSDE